MQFITIGYGCVAPIHHNKFNDHDVKPIGIIETNANKYEDILKKGFRVCKTYEEAVQLKPDFWDICCPVEGHVTVIEKIISLDPYACIIVEKPVCNFEEIPKLQNLLKNFHGKIVVNENYLSSETTKKIKNLVKELKLDIKKIYLEMDKNRTRDFIVGRYVDPKGAFYYEGTHMVTILKDIIKQYHPNGEITKTYEDLEVPGKKFIRQGLAEIAYIANDVSINLFTSMKGNIKNPYPPLNLSHIPVEDTVTRYRIAAVEGTDKKGEAMTVVGFFEPINGFERSQSAIAIFKESELVEYIAPIEDDSMGRHLKSAIDYFEGITGKNPCNAEEGIEVVNILNTLSP